MMNWNGGWAWAWMMTAMMLVIVGLVAAFILPRAGTTHDRSHSPIDRLEERLAAGEITIGQYRSYRSELEHRSSV